MGEKKFNEISSGMIAKEGKFDLGLKMLESEKPLTSKDVKEYVDGIVELLKKYSSDDLKQQTVFLDDLSIDTIKTKKPRGNLFERFFVQVSEKYKEKFDIKNKNFLDSISEDEFESVVGHFRDAAMEELKNRLVNDKELENLSYDDVHFITENFLPFFHKFPKTKNLNNRNFILKAEHSDSEEQKQNHQQALEKLGTISSPYIVKVQSYDSQGVDLKTLQSFEDLTTFNASEDLIRKSKGDYNETSFKEKLLILKDCIQGALDLKRNGLVLTDIRLANLGYVERDGKKVGVLFDMDGLYLEGMKLKGRRGLVAPEAGGTEPVALNAKEMSWQFGMCLQAWKANEGLSLSSSMIKKTEDLISKLIAFDPDSPDPLKGRCDLEEAIPFLQELVQEIEQSQLN